MCVDGDIKPYSLTHSKWTWVCWYQNVSILDFNGAKDDESGSDSWSY